MWCNVVKLKLSIADGEERAPEAMKSTATAVRASISFPPEIYETLEIIAREKKVSLAWVVREAAEIYIQNKWPLFGKQQ